MTNTNSIIDWVTALAERYPRTIDLGLERIQQQAEQAGLLSDWPCPIIHVAGTNGKGSCVRLLEQTYLQAGYKVCAYTSPHILQFNERIRLNGEMVSDELLLKACTHLEPLISKQGTTFFEFTTLLAFQIARWFKPDVFIVEVGLGGRLDATNILNADVAIVTSIGLDHCEYLGYNRDAIATEKAGIFKANSIAICGDDQAPVTILKRAQELGISCRQLGSDFSYLIDGDHWQYTTKDVSKIFPMPKLKVQNVAISMAVVDALQFRLPVNEAVVVDAMHSTTLEGRFEQIDGDLPMVLDVAHNEDSMTYLAQQCKRRGYQQMTAVVGMLKTKDAFASLLPMKDVVEHWHLVELPDDRGLAVDKLAEVLARIGVKSWYTWADMDAALDACRASGHVSEQQPLLVFGSFVTVGLVKQRLHLTQGRKSVECTN